MTPEELLSITKTAFNTMGSEHDSLGPKSLREMFGQAAANYGTTLSDSQFKQILDALLSNDVNDPSRRLFTEYLHRWDFIQAKWAADTSPNTQARRLRIYELLALDQNRRSQATSIIPPRTDTEKPTLIAKDHEEWYTPLKKSERQFYWKAYQQYLRKNRNWPGESIVELDRSTDLVLQHISNPERPEAYQSKGLVVGYVQSGKTANFTAVIAKAADAGYRLFIVLAGTLDLLRNQTQRRVDKEMIGKELIQKYTPLGQDHDYAGDEEWESFLEHGGLPCEMGAFDWHRLTGPRIDYKSLLRGLPALEFERQFNDRSLIAPENLHHTRSRLVIVKKHPNVLKKLIADLRGLIHTPLGQIPTIIIDDESDQASVNTQRPTAEEKEQKKIRTKTNLCIVDLLRILPRAQYVAYTATPFANVFIDPSDAEDIFPKDFIIALKKPSGYMGASDFFDWGEHRPPGMKSNESAFVRNIVGDDREPNNLRKAIDSFVLSGAIKLYRTSKSAKLKFHHHTMLVHRSHQMIHHDEDAGVVKAVFEQAKYDSAASLNRLEELYKSDFLAVSGERLEDWTPPMPHFGELKQYVNQCYEKVRGRPVSVVNGDDRRKEEAPDFDRGSIWRILVGGTKLSRGYTVEGLTVSYYRRKARNTDTLMQMGRWFGFRRGYKDLVRLFIARAEPDHKGTFDLYEAFRAICRDEEDFRKKLDRYSFISNPRITPRDVPPLVPSHLLPPTSRNKMYNAVLTSENLGGDWSESTLATRNQTDVNHNAKEMTALLQGKEMRAVDLSLTCDGQRRRGKFLTCVLGKAETLAFFETYRWARVGGFLPALEFMRGKMGDPGFSEWLFMAPQLKEGDLGSIELNGHRLSVAERARDERNEDRFKAYSEPRHRDIAEYLADFRECQDVSPETRSLRSNNRAIFLFYPCRAIDDPKARTTMGFALFFPRNGIKQIAQFSVRDKNREEAVTVEVPKKGKSSG